MKRFLPFLIVLAACLGSCRHSIIIERNEALERVSTLKVVCIEPKFYFVDDDNKHSTKKINKLTERVKENVVSASKKNKIDLTLMSMNVTKEPGFYYDLLNLKKNFLSANFNQTTPLNFNQKAAGRNEIQKKVFVYPPKISHDFARLSKIYGTPYFSYLGIYHSDKGMVLYHVIVDIEQAETVYREYKIVHGRLKKDVMDQMIHDSFAMLKENLTTKVSEQTAKK